MTKTSIFLAAAVIAGTASAFAPPVSTRATSCLFEDVAAEAAPAAAVEAVFCRGYVGGEGPEPIPFSGIKQTSVDWDPLDFAGVSSTLHTWLCQDGELNIISRAVV
jgi:hypothetical protein